MNKNNKIALFEGKKIRRHWDEKSEKWFFSVIDVVEILAQTARPRKYWDDLKRKLKAEGSQLSEKIGQLKFQASDGKLYLSDAADTETIFRIIQSIPSPNAEPFKLWLARVGYERIEEAENPEIAIFQLSFQLILSFPRKRESRSYSYRFPVKLGMTMVYV